MSAAGGYLKSVSIERMTNNTNPVCLFCCCCCWFFCLFFCRGGGQGKGRVGGEVGEISLIYDTLYRPITHCHKFSSRYSFRLPTYGFHKNSLRNLTPKIIKGKQ